MKKFLIAYDGSPGAEQAIRDLVRSGFPEQAEGNVFTVADVWVPPEVPAERSSAEPARTLSEQNGREVLEHAQTVAVDGARLLHEIFPEWNVSNSAKADSPAWGILTQAEEWKADVIVVGSHGRNALERFFLGSVSYKIAAEAPCSVRVARPFRHQNELLHVLIAVDNSRDSRRAVQEVLSRRWLGGMEAHLVMVVDAKLKSSVLARPDLMGKDRSVERFEDWAEPMMNGIRDELVQAGLRAQIHIIEGDPKDTLLRYAGKLNIDTIFLGARGMEHRDRLYLGTVASAICSRAHCTVEIVRELNRNPLIASV